MRNTLLRDVTLLNVTRRRFFAPPKAFTTDNANVTLDAEEAHHLRNVLRLGAGDEVFVFDGEGKEYRCVVREGGRNREVMLDVCNRVAPAQPESPLELSLCVALLKGEKFDWVVQKATELGVVSITPVVTERADVRLRKDDDAARRTARLKRLALEAAKQSGRARVPIIDAPVPFASLLERAISSGEDRRLMFAERGGDGLAWTFSEWATPPARVMALVGPEGGWEDEEITAARDAGWIIVTLGGRTLRAETAAITVTALLQHLCGDLI